MLIRGSQQKDSRAGQCGAGPSRAVPSIIGRDHHTRMSCQNTTAVRPSGHSHRQTPNAQWSALAGSISVVSQELEGPHQLPEAEPSSALCCHDAPFVAGGVHSHVVEHGEDIRQDSP